MTRSLTMPVERVVPESWGKLPKHFWNPRILAIVEDSLGPRFVDTLQSIQTDERKQTKRRDQNDIKIKISKRPREDSVGQSISTAAVENEPVSMKYLLSLIGHICKVLLVPLPHIMVNKVAFMPPNKHYQLVDYQTRVPFKNAKKALKSSDVDAVFDIESEFFSYRLPEWAKKGLSVYEVKVIKTKEKDYITTVRVFSNKTLHTGVQSEKVILLSQPNATDIGCWMQANTIALTLIEMADLMECDFVVYDYNGYGTSPGRPDEHACYRNVEAVYDWIITELEYNPEDVYLFGLSLGTAVSIHLASLHERITKMILIAPFTSLLRICPRIPIVGRQPDNGKSCCLDRFNSYEKAPNVQARTLLIHGKADKLIDIQHSEVLLNLFPNPCEPLYVDKADHETIVYQPMVWKRIWYFVNRDK